MIMMKKGIYAFLAVLTVFALVMTGCPGSDPAPAPGPGTFTVTFNSMGGSTVAPITGVTLGATIDRPEDPTTTEDKDFGGWFKDEDCTEEWDFDNDTVTSNIILYAKWNPPSQLATLRQIKINNQDIDTVANSSIGDPDSELEFVSPGAYEPGVIQPAGGVSIAVTPTTNRATVKWVVKSTDPTDTDFTNSTNATKATNFI